MSDDDVEWFCAECEFDGSEDEVKEHAKRFQHRYGAGEYLFMADFQVTSMGVTACPLPEGMEMMWVHANYCWKEGCPNPVLEDEEVRDHIRKHLAKGE
jgi:hypothetical protein